MSEKQNIQEVAKKSLDILKAIIDNINHAVAVFDEERNVLYANALATKVYQINEGELFGLDTINLCSGNYVDKKYLKAIWQDVLSGTERLFKWPAKRPEDGHIFLAEVFLKKIDIPSKNAFLIMARDISVFEAADKELKDTKERLKFLAYFDQLTGLSNRLLLSDRLEQAILHARHHSEKIGVLHIDLDGFKLVNSTMGYKAGDILLQRLGKRIKGIMRDSDTLARLGGDEFAIIVHSIDDTLYVNEICKRVLGAAQMPFVIDGHELFISVSIGIAIYPDDGTDADMLLRNTETAMYQAKAAGKNSYAFYSADITKKYKYRFRIQNELKKAIERSEFILFYQPKIDLYADRIIGAEALIRWNHPEKGLIFPDLFIPIAEEAGLIQQLGHWVIKEAATQVKKWRVALRNDFSLALNISAVQFLNGDVSKEIGTILREVSIPPEALEVELTESSLMGDLDKSILVITQLKDLGVKIAIDDFGTGYSSLAYLTRFSVNVLKIERSFIQKVFSSNEATTITEAIISLGSGMRMEVIAEGVETEEQLLFLRQRGCRYAQGYYFSPALPAEEFEEFFFRWKGLDPVGVV